MIGRIVKRVEIKNVITHDIQYADRLSPNMNKYSRILDLFSSIIAPAFIQKNGTNANHITIANNSPAIGIKIWKLWSLILGITITEK